MIHCESLFPLQITISLLKQSTAANFLHALNWPPRSSETQKLPKKHTTTRQSHKVGVIISARHKKRTIAFSGVQSWAFGYATFPHLGTHIFREIWKSKFPHPSGFKFSHVKTSHRWITKFPRPGPSKFPNL